LMFINRRVPSYFGWVAISLTLECQSDQSHNQRITITDGDEAVATATVREGRESNIRLSISPLNRLPLTAYFAGDKNCRPAASNPVTVRDESEPLQTIQQLPESYIEPSSVPTVEFQSVPSTWRDPGLVTNTDGLQPSEQHPAASPQVHDEEDSY
jgi:hypothetical protein